MSQTRNEPEGMVVAILMTAGTTKSGVEYRVGLLPQADALEKKADHPSASAPAFNREAAIRCFGAFGSVVSRRPRHEAIKTPVDKEAQKMSVDHAPKCSSTDEVEPLEIIFLDFSRISFPKQRKPFLVRMETAASAESL